MRALLAAEDLVYYADQAHVPYGDRSAAELERLLAHNVAYLEGCGVDAIVMGCNTSCAIAASRGWPRCSVPILDLIAAAADEVAHCGARRVGVIGTLATIRAGAYGDAIRQRDPTIVVQEVAAPALVPLVESGRHIGPLARDAVAAACAQLNGPLDALVLACTHYPLLDSHFAAILADVPRIDPAQAQARRAAAFVQQRASTTLAPPLRAHGSGHIEYVTTGELEPYRRAVEAIVDAPRSHAGFATAAALQLSSPDAAPLPVT
ncbi:MAG: aspartate/glutamate racemase family protein [Candidatus Eremiobacteraeota bacterium]|nr:aspartate/glutamate racemase family protein [Candidatus Eremiobacteraeota bacterium]